MTSAVIRMAEQILLSFTEPTTAATHRPMSDSVSENPSDVTQSSMTSSSVTQSDVTSSDVNRLEEEEGTQLVQSNADVCDVRDVHVHDVCDVNGVDDVSDVLSQSSQNTQMTQMTQNTQNTQNTQMTQNVQKPPLHVSLDDVMRVLSRTSFLYDRSGDQVSACMTRA